MGEDSSSPTSVDEGRIAERVRVLIDRGLERYGEGDLRGALAEWEHALALSPSSDRAREYVDYVRQNFEVLQASFDEAKEVARVAAELDVPFGLEAVGESDEEEDDYASMEVQIGASEEGEESGDGDAAEAADQDPATAQVSDSVDEGWFLDDYADALPPPPQTAQAPREDLATELEAVPTGMLGIDADSGAVSVPDVATQAATEAVDDDDIDESEPTLKLDGPPTPPAKPAQDDDAALEIEAELPPESGPEEAAASEDEQEFEDDEQTVERGATAGTPPPPAAASAEEHAEIGDEEEITVPGGEEPPPFSASVSFSEDALAALGPEEAVARAEPDETTAERPGIVKREITLSGLDELDTNMRRDDRVLANEERPAVPQVTFRSDTAERHAWAGSITDDADDIDEEEKTIERRAPELTDLDDEMTVERRSDHFSTPAVIVDESLMADELPTVEQPISDAEDRSGAMPGSELDFGESDGDQLTRERPRDMLAAGARSRPGGEGESVVTLTAEIREHLDDEAPEGESDEERSRRRVTALVERARDEADAGNHAGAVAVLAVAMTEDPDNAAAQMVIHRHRDMLYDIYSGYVGDMNGVPFVSRPMDELSTDELDNRAVFLLSRIDGTLSFEEVLDVSGMPRLEAYGVLCKMLLQGILEVR